MTARDGATAASRVRAAGTTDDEMPRRIIVVDPSLRDNVGHHVEYDLSLLDGARRRGKSVVVLAHREAGVMLTPDEGIVPAFSEDMWGARRARIDRDVRLKALAHRAAAGATIVLPLLAGAGWLLWRSGLDRRIGRIRARLTRSALRALRPLLRPSLAIKLLDVLRESAHRLGSLAAVRPVLFLALWNPKFYFELTKQLDRLGFGAQDLVFCHMATHRHLMEWAWLASGLERGAFPRVVLLLRYPAAFYAPSSFHSRIAFRLLERAFSQGKLRLATDSERLAREFARHTYVPFEIFPIPHTGAHELAANARSGDEKVCFASLGNARAEKGILEILEAVKLVQARYERWREVEFFLQLNDPDARCAADVRKFLAELPPNVRYTESAMPSAEYQRLVASVDAVLVPYWGEVYASRTSGTFLEAVAAGKPVIATANTWMSDELAGFGAGIAIPSHSPQALADAIVEVHRTIGACRARARASAQAFVARHSAAALLHRLLNRAARVPGARRKVLVVFPWRDLFKKVTGASIRTTHLIDYLQGRGWRVSARFPRSRLEALLLFFRFGRWRRSKAGDRLAYMHRRWHRTRRFRIALNRALIGCDAVFVEYTFLVDIVKPFAVARGIPMIVTSYDVLASEVTDDADAARAVLEVEARMLGLADFAVSVSEDDRKVFRSAGAETIVVPNSMAVQDVRRVEPEAAARILSGLGIAAGRPFALFFGSRYGPNHEARDFLKKLAPEIGRRVPGALVVVAGSCASPSDSAGNFRGLGVVSEEAKAALYEGCGAVAIPLLRGTGTSLKTIEAMAYGRPVVGTSVAFRGIPVEPGVHALVQDDPSRFCDRLVEALERADWSGAIGRNGKAFAARFDYRRTYAPYAEFLERTAAHA